MILLRIILIMTFFLPIGQCLLKSPIFSIESDLSFDLKGSEEEEEEEDDEEELAA